MHHEREHLEKGGENIQKTKKNTNLKLVELAVQVEVPDIFVKV